MIFLNEFDPKAAAWCRALSAQGSIPEATVDERSITEIQPDDLLGYAQQHFFAGIAGWPEALRLAGWPEDREVWTGSCPCQPFSSAGKQQGFADERHLWPEFRRLIEACRPPVVFGEQVASKAGRTWLNIVRSEMEALGYEFGASDLCAASVGAPHIRQRIFFGAYDLRSSADWLEHAKSNGRIEWRPESGGWCVAGGCSAEPLDDADGARFSGPIEEPKENSREQARVRLSGTRCSADWLVNSFQSRLEGHARNGDDRHESGRIGTDQTRSAPKAGAIDGLADCHSQGQCECPECDCESLGRIEASQRTDAGGCGGVERMADAESERLDGCEDSSKQTGRRGAEDSRPTHRPSPTNGFWRDADWIFCRDSKWRPVEPGSQPLVDGIPGRVALLRGYGNAINVELAAQFIQAFEEAVIDLLTSERK